jgi:hypothetical protein
MIECAGFESTIRRGHAGFEKIMLKHNQVLGQHGGDAMTGHAYDKATTALLFVDPYNDFLSEGGKVWPRLKDIAIEVGLAR